MAVIVERIDPVELHPVNAVLMAAAIPLFAGAVLCDIAYMKTYLVEWTTFASWLLAGGLLVSAFALVAAVVALFRADARRGRVLVYALLVIAAWVLGFIDALVHAKDAWAAMPAGLWLSIVVMALACIATWIAFSGLRAGGVR